MVQKDETEAFHKNGYKPASDYDRCLTRIGNILRYWRRSDKHFSNKVVEKLKFAYHEFSLTRYSIFTDNGTEKDSNVEVAIPKSQKKGDTALSRQKEMPKAWLDMLDKSNVFPKHDAQHFRICYGLKDFIVVAIIEDEDIPYRLTNFLLKIFSFVALKCKCELPLFVKCATELPLPATVNPGILECPGFRTSFKNRKGNSIKSKTCHNVNLKEITECFQHDMEYPIQGPAKVYTTLIYYIDVGYVSYYPCKEQPYGFISNTDFGIGTYERPSNWYDRKRHQIGFYLNASWSDQSYSEVISCEANLGFNPLDAPKWSIRADIADTSEDPLGDCLKSILSLLSSTQTESLLSKPEFISMLKYRRLYKQREEVNASLTMQGLMEPKVRKVTSKLLLKPEESLIPVESLNAILDFLFHDAKLQSSQHSNGSNPSTTTTVEDEVEDKFYLAYKELSKYFKSTQSSSLLSRLAICLCIVNKYHGGLGAVNQLWGEFVLEMKYCLENNCKIKGLQLVEPTLENSELLQKLQMLNRSIKKKKARNGSSPATDSFSTTNTLNFNEEFTDISELPLGKESNGQSQAWLDTSTVTPLLRVRMLFDRMAAMNAFEAANPGFAIGDFVTWCSDEDWMEELVTDEEKDKITNKNHQGLLNQRIKISDGVSLVFHKTKSQRRFSENDDAAKALHWLALVKPSDLVLKLMPTLIHSATTTLLKHPICQLAFLQEHLNLIRNKLIDQFCNGLYLCTDCGIKMLEDHVHQLALIEQKMAEAQYLLKAFRCVDPSCMVSDSELEKYVSDLVEFKEVPVKTLRGELPSRTGFGKLIYKFFCDYQEEEWGIEKNKSHNEAAEVKVNLKPLYNEYVLMLDCSKTTGSCLRLHGISRETSYKFAAAFTDKLQPPKE